MPPLILASTSPYRRELLARLQVPFEVIAPAVDEAALPGEAPHDIACRLALAKAEAVRAGRPGAVVIGSDQVADLDGVAIGKPGSRAAAQDQLQAMQGRTVVFHTALAVVATGLPALRACVHTEVRLRALSAAAIDAYVDREPSFDCAGSARIEALGIALMESVRSDDPSALVGLPLIALCRMLADRGLPVLPQ